MPTAKELATMGDLRDLNLEDMDEGAEVHIDVPLRKEKRENTTND